MEFLLLASVLFSSGSCHHLGSELAGGNSLLFQSFSLAQVFKYTNILKSLLFPLNIYHQTPFVNFHISVMLSSMQKLSVEYLDMAIITAEHIIPSRSGTGYWILWRNGQTVNHGTGDILQVVLCTVRAPVWEICPTAWGGLVGFLYREILNTKCTRGLSWVEDHFWESFR